MSGPALIHLDEAVRCFRLGMDGAAHTAFVEFLDAFQGELAQAEEEDVAYFWPRIAAMLSALELDDTVWVADMLLADFRPALV